MPNIRFKCPNEKPELPGGPAVCLVVATGALKATFRGLVAAGLAVGFNNFLSTLLSLSSMKICVGVGVYPHCQSPSLSLTLTLNLHLQDSLVPYRNSADYCRNSGDHPKPRLLFQSSPLRKLAR